MLREVLGEGIDRARATGHVVTIDPPMTSERIAELESRCGALPPDVRALVEYTAGFSIDDVAIDFSGREPFELEALFPCSVPIGTDGEGNFRVVDVSSGGEWGAVFFIAHDPPVAILQARHLASFLRQILDTPERAATKDAANRIWSDNPDLVSRAEALASPDPAVRALAEQVSDEFAIADIREEGKGFVWGAAGPNTVVRRAGEELVFAIQQKKKRSVFSRLFSS
jgi:hypothetical protein